MTHMTIMPVFLIVELVMRALLATLSGEGKCSHHEKLSTLNFITGIYVLFSDCNSKMFVIPRRIGNMPF